MKKVILIIALIIALIILIKPFLYWENDTIGITRYTVSSDKIPPSFDGYKILQIADIQGKDFGNNNQKFINKIESVNSDMIVFTGDLVDEGVPTSKSIMDNLLKNTKVPNEVYAISGNHDLWTGKFDEYISEWGKNYNIKFLENKSITISKDGYSINLFGIADPDIWDIKKATDIVNEDIHKLKISNNYNILLFHRANMLDMFIDSQYDLVLSGHIHGGQIGVPFLGGLRSPHGDWFPKYSGGKYQNTNNIFIVSRGVGNAVWVPRIFNRPELVVITLKSK